MSEMEEFMQKLKENVTVGIVGGSDYKKITEQLGLVWFSLCWVWVGPPFSLNRLTRTKKIYFTVVFRSFLNVCVRDRWRDQSTTRP